MPEEVLIRFGNGLKFRIRHKFITLVKYSELNEKAIQEIHVERIGSEYSATFRWESEYPGMRYTDMIVAFRDNLSEIWKDLGLDELTKKTLMDIIDGLAKRRKLLYLVSTAMNPLLWEVIKENLWKTGRAWEAMFYDMSSTYVIESECFKVMYGLDEELASVTMKKGDDHPLDWYFMGEIPVEEAHELYEKMRGEES